MAVLLFAPLPLASNRLWSWSLLGVLSGALCIAMTAAVLLAPAQSRQFRRALILPGLVITAMATWITLQTLCTVPPDLAHPAWSLLGLETSCTSLSAVPVQTWTALARLLTYISVFWVAAELTVEASRARRLLEVAALSVTGYAAYGLVIHFMGIKPTLFFETWRYNGVVTSTFVNRNAFSAFAGMGAVLTLAPPVHRLLAARSSRGDHRPRIGEVIAQAPAWLAGFVICLVAVILTASRGGMAATCVGLIVLVITLGLHHRVSWRARTTGTVVTVAFVVVAVLAGGSALVSRLDQTDENWEVRGMVIGQTLQAATDQPWTGTGYGTFEEVWPQYRPVGVDKWFRQAHNTYVENALELGFPAALALMLALGLVLVVCARGIVRRRRDGVYPSVALACACVPIVHSTIDFSLQTPAVVVFTMVLLGMGFAQSFSTRAAGDQGSPAADTTRPPG